MNEREQFEEIAAALEKDKWHVSAVDLQRAANLIRELEIRALINDGGNNV